MDFGGEITKVLIQIHIDERNKVHEAFLVVQNGLYSILTQFVAYLLTKILSTR